MTFKIYDGYNRPALFEIDRVAKFLHTHLDAYGDTLTAIKKAIQYAVGERAGMGGYLFVAEQDDAVVGAVVVNKTGMEDYIPENILVYIATHAAYRGQGIGRKLMEQVIAHCSGDIALHVEKDNPARMLYEKLGFSNPYLEMRLKKA